MGISETGSRALRWLVDGGLTEQEVLDLNPCVPGEFTLTETCYVNTATPRIVYHAGGEGTLPLVSGRWYIIPDNIVDRHPELRNDTVPVARSVRLTR